MHRAPRTIIILLLCGILLSGLLALIAVQLVRTPPPNGQIDPQRLNLSEFRQLGLIPTSPNRYILRMVAKEWFYDIGQARDIPAVIRIPAGSQVALVATSMDVMHSLQFTNNPVLLIQPGVIARQTLVFDRAGTYVSQCVTYCGPKHDTMQITITVTP